MQISYRKLCNVQSRTHLFQRFLDDKEFCFSFFFLCIIGIFLVFHDKILYYIFMTIFIFYEAPKRSRVFLFHLIQLLINFEKGIRRQLHFLSLQLHLFKKTRNVFCLKLIKVKLFNFSVWHFYFLRKNIWQTCLFLPNSIKICRKQKDFSARFVSWDVFLVSTKNVCYPPKFFSLRNTSKSMRFQQGGSRACFALGVQRRYIRPFGQLPLIKMQ